MPSAWPPPAPPSPPRPGSLAARVPDADARGLGADDALAASLQGRQAGRERVGSAVQPPDAGAASSDVIAVGAAASAVDPTPTPPSDVDDASSASQPHSAGGGPPRGRGVAASDCSRSPSSPPPASRWPGVPPTGAPRSDLPTPSRAAHARAPPSPCSPPAAEPLGRAAARRGSSAEEAERRREEAARRPSGYHGAPAPLDGRNPLEVGGDVPCEEVRDKDGPTLRAEGDASSAASSGSEGSPSRLARGSAGSSASRRRASGSEGPPPSRWRRSAGAEGAATPAAAAPPAAAPVGAAAAAAAARPAAAPVGAAAAAAAAPPAAAPVGAAAAAAAARPAAAPVGAAAAAAAAPPAAAPVGAAAAAGGASPSSGGTDGSPSSDGPDGDPPTAVGGAPPPKAPPLLAPPWLQAMARHGIARAVPDGQMAADRCARSLAKSLAVDAGMARPPAVVSDREIAAVARQVAEEWVDAAAFDADRAEEIARFAAAERGHVGTAVVAAIDAAIDAAVEARQVGGPGAFFDVESIRAGAEARLRAASLLAARPPPPAHSPRAEWAARGLTADAPAPPPPAAPAAPPAAATEASAAERQLHDMRLLLGGHERAARDAREALHRSQQMLGRMGRAMQHWARQAVAMAAEGS
ncbi:unnamed protein product [Prorocentrum cordatum]|uniref:Uncharacterized protein n=1 Tax=Prorocentrum cordatum TaxID=2364126 RepID=A0ABN9RJH9_9DINO|nr:unnamed protein product [Polarella glacialis]